MGNFPLWQVGIGAGNAPAKFTVPSGYCYANACLEDFATIGTQPSRGQSSLVRSSVGPTWLLLLITTRVAGLTVLVSTPLPTGTGVRLRLLSAPALHALLPVF